MKYNIKLYEEIDENTDIEWWNEARRKINEAIKMVNDWQINHRQDEYYAELTLAKVVSLRKWNEDNNYVFGEWQEEILNDIEEHVKSVIESE